MPVLPQRASDVSSAAPDPMSKESASQAASPGAVVRCNRSSANGKPTALNGPAGLAAAAKLYAEHANCEPASGPAVDSPSAAQQERDQPHHQELENALTTIPGSRQVVSAGHHQLRPGSGKPVPAGKAKDAATDGSAVPVWTQVDASSKASSGSEGDAGPASTALIRADPGSTAVIQVKQGSTVACQRQHSNARGRGNCPPAAANAANRLPPATENELPAHSKESEQLECSPGGSGEPDSAECQIGQQPADGKAGDDGLAHEQEDECAGLPSTWSQASTGVSAARCHELMHTQCAQQMRPTGWFQEGAASAVAHHPDQTASHNMHAVTS